MDMVVAKSVCAPLANSNLPLAPTLSHLRRLSHMRRPWLTSLSARAASAPPLVVAPPSRALTLVRRLRLSRAPLTISRAPPACAVPHAALTTPAPSLAHAPCAVPRPCPLRHPSPMPPAPTTRRSCRRYDAPAAHTTPLPPTRRPRRRLHDAVTTPPPPHS
ncbi:hypothetical protein DENSPDRAFT_886860 [Dentipellis sp. KUC8613]|nr:hypothetical protein DENSPDRAFT_886860 [Dentipellis sp. KUC8613]